MSQPITQLRATARLQFHPGFTLDDATALVDYFADLGISHLYASPLTRARPGSMHGYDVVDPTRINPELGGEAALERLVAALRAKGMGLILDIVPNHMAVSDANPWWRSVLEWGVSSPYAAYFDINWRVEDPLLHRRVLAPFLGRDYAQVLEDGELQLDYDAAQGIFSLTYFDNRFPLTPASYADILHRSQDHQLNQLAVHFAALEGCRRGPQKAPELHRELVRFGSTPDGLRLIHQAMTAFDSKAVGHPAPLHALLECQHYRLANWRTAADEINWRRFFDINELISLRIESHEVFEAAHGKIFELIERGLVDGLRIDHIDGLADPRGYCRKLRRRVEGLRGENATSPFPIHVEKILGVGESVPADWQVDGTTGYEFMNQISLLQHDPAGEAPLHRFWASETARTPDFLQEVYEARRLVLTHSLAADFETVAQGLMRLARTEIATRDITLNGIRRVLLELIANFTVYRTYAAACGRSEQDRVYFRQARQAASVRLSPADMTVLDQLDRWLGGEPLRRAPPGPVRRLRRRVLQRFHQLTSPAAAKAVEDTAFYRSGVLLSRNDVGFDPEHFQAPPVAFHEANIRRHQLYPRNLLTTATHDHKRGEDTRARLAVISERAAWYVDRVRHWQQLAAPLRRAVGEVSAPSPADELMLYQTLLASWPLDLQCDDIEGLQTFHGRVAGWQEKALREAKLISSWSAPATEYETACRDFLSGLLFDDRFWSLRAAIADAAQRLAPAGALNSLAQSLLRLTVPGVPDLYQGTEFWDFSLVDPDNRRPVDYAERRQALSRSASPEDLLSRWHDGHIKQWLVARVLRWRATHPALFQHGQYQPLEICGRHADRLLAFARTHADQTMVVVVPVRAAALLGDSEKPLIAAQQWDDTAVRLPGHLQTRALGNLLTDETVRVEGDRIAASELLARVPVGFIHVQSDTDIREQQP